MTVNNPLDRAVLTDARARRTPWYEIVQAIQNLQSQELHDHHGRPWIAFAQDVSGYNYIQLREMMRTFDTVVWLADRVNSSIDSILLGYSKHHIEILSRVKKIDESSAIEVFLKMTKEKTTVNSLRNIYDAIKHEKKSVNSNASVGKKLSTDFERSVIGISKELKADMYDLLNVKFNNRELVSCKISEYSGRRGYISPTILAVLDYGKGDKFLAALDCAFTSIENEDKVSRRLKSASFDATYFSMFYLIIPSWSNISCIKNILDFLQIDNVGIVSADIVSQSIHNHDCGFLKHIKKQERSLKNAHEIIGRIGNVGEEMIVTENEDDFLNFPQ